MSDAQTSNSTAVTINNDLDADGYTITRYDRYVDADGGAGLGAPIERVGSDVVLQLVSRVETVAEHDELRSVLQEDYVRVLQFSGDDPLDPTRHD